MMIMFHSLNISSDLILIFSSVTLQFSVDQDHNVSNSVKIKYIFFLQTIYNQTEHMGSENDRMYMISLNKLPKQNYGNE